MRSLILASYIFFQLVLPIAAVVSVSNVHQYAGSNPLNFVPLARKKRESTDSDDSDNWQIPDDYEKESGYLVYYEKNLLTGENALKEHFVDLDELLKKTGVVGNSSHPLLLNSYRRAVGAKLTFQFPFYGHPMNNLTIATGGFVYLGEESHSWLAATQYAAALMANFDTNRSDSRIIYADDGKRFIVEWRKVQLREQAEEGPFTFQITLHKNGDIVFAYKDIPMDVVNISSREHPLKSGVSDAYLYTHVSKGDPTAAPKRVIYEYHRVEVSLEDIKSNTVVYLTAQPTCIGLTSCGACSNATLKHFNCSWCPNPKQDGGSFCTDEAGLHRKRQAFIEGSCMEQSKNIYCGPEDDEDQTDGVVNLGKYSRKAKSSQRSSGSGIALLVFLFGLSLGGVGWLAYAYYNPHTTSGQMLIKYRPSRWSVPHSHVRYSASVHM